MEINLFNGGINLLKDPRKLAPTESLVIDNAEVLGGSIVSTALPEFVQGKVSPRFVSYRNHVVSDSDDFTTFTEMHNMLFKTNGVAPKFTYGSRDHNGRLEWYPMSVEAPEINILVEEVLPQMANGATIQSMFSIDPRLTGSSQTMLYDYLFILDDVPMRIQYQCPETCRVVNFDFTNLRTHDGKAYTTFNLFRRVNNIYYHITDNKRDFYLFDNRPYHRKGPLTFTTGKNHGTYGRHPGAHVTWRGDGTLYWIAYVSDSSYRKGIVGTTANFKTGAGVGNTTLMPRRGLNVFVKSSRKIAFEQYEFEIWCGYKTQFLWKGWFREDGYKLTYYPDRERIRTPRSLNFGKKYACNSRGPSIDMNISEAFGSHMVGDFEYRATASGPSGEYYVSADSTDISSIGSAIKVTIEEVELPANQQALDTINLYRRSAYQGYGSVFLLCKTFPLINATYPIIFLDDTRVEDLGRMAPLRSNIPIPDDIMYLREYTGRLFGATRGFVVNPLVYDENGSGEIYPSYIPANGDIVVYTGTGYTYTGGTLAGHTLATDDNIIFKDGVWELLEDVEEGRHLEHYTTLIYSELGKPNEWNGLNFINTVKPIVGLGRTANGLVIYNKTECHILMNTHTEAFSLKLISASHGCVSHLSIQTWQGSAICASKDGITVTNGGDIKLVSYKHMGIMYMEGQVRDSTIVGNNYFLLLDDYIIRYDMEYSVFTTLSQPSVLGISGFRGELLMVDDGMDMSVIPFNDRGEDTYHYVSGYMTDAALCNLKEYDKVRVGIEGNAVITILIQFKGEPTVVIEELVLKDDTITTIVIPNEFNKGYAIGFEVHGVGSLFSIEYSTKGRDNG